MSEPDQPQEPIAAIPPLFFIDELPTNDRAVLRGEEAWHAGKVRRVRPGEEVRLSTGRGEVVAGVIANVQLGKTVTVEVTVIRRWVEPKPQPLVTVVQALAKGERGELAAELATEAGADRIIAWQASRSVARWEDEARAAKALSRWRTVVRAAAKQSRRGWIPEVPRLYATVDVLALIRTSGLAIVLEAGAVNRLGDLSIPAQGEIVLIVGPEGGLTEQEITGFSGAGAVPVRLGPTVLRTSTAAAVALGALGVLTRRWA